MGHKHEWVLIDTYDSQAIRPLNLQGHMGDYSLSIINNYYRERVVEIITQPRHTSETWACHCGKTKYNHHTEPSASELIDKITARKTKPTGASK